MPFGKPLLMRLNSVSNSVSLICPERVLFLGTSRRVFARFSVSAAMRKTINSLRIGKPHYVLPREISILLLSPSPCVFQHPAAFGRDEILLLFESELFPF